MDKKALKKWIKKHDIAVNVILFIVGLSCFFIGRYINKGNGTTAWGDLISEIGLAFITNAFLLASSLLFFKDDKDFDEAKEIYDEVGLINIYDSKKEMNERINGQLLPNHNIIDYDIICCGGLGTLLKENGSDLIEYIKKNRMRIRILTANPTLDYLLQKKIDEDSIYMSEKDYSTTPVSNEIKKAIFDLFHWVNEQKDLLPIELKDNLQIRFYNTLPPAQYHRVGNHMFISLSMVGAQSQASSAFEFIDSNNPNDYFSKYTRYFENIWNDPNLTQSEPVVKLNPKNIINNNVINNILRLSSLEIANELEVDINRIGALFTICGYPKPFSDGKQRRYNTNVVRSGEVINIENSTTNGEIVNGKKLGYDSKDEKQVVGKCIRDGEIKFELTKERGRYSILSIPFKNNNKEIVAALTYEFDSDCNSSLHIDNNCKIGEDITEENEDLINKIEKWSKLLSIYLHLQEI